MSKLRRFLVVCCCQVVVILAVVSLILFSIRDSIDWNAVVNGRGEAIPTSAPSEDRRVHTAAFSIVLPERWHSTTYGGAEAGYTELQAWPDMVLPTRYGAGIRATMSPEPPRNLEELAECEFLDGIAYEAVRHRNHGGLENPPYFSYTVAFKRAGTWCMLHYWNFEVMQELPPVLSKYMETFRLASDYELPTEDNANGKLDPGSQ